MDDEALRAKLCRWVEQAGQVSVASKCRVSQPAISQMVNGHVPIGPSVFLAMGYRRVTTYVPIEEPRP